MPQERRDPSGPSRWRSDTKFSIGLLAQRMEVNENRLYEAIDELRAEIKALHESFDKRVDELEEWHLADTAITGERIAQRAHVDRQWVRASLAVGIAGGLGGLIGLLSALHVI